jgi:hypothetical protein
MNVFAWHVHGSWMTSFVQGDHRFSVPVTPDRGPEGRGRARTWDWPSNVHEVDRAGAHDLPLDVVVLQRPQELEWATAWLGGRVPGRDVPLVYVEHNTPRGSVHDVDHPLRDRGDVVVVHVTGFNALFWDTGSTRTCLIEHGIVDPGYRYTGDIAHLAVVVNDAIRRGRATGTDLLPLFEHAAPLDIYGFNASLVGGYEDLDQAALHDALARRRVYLHPYRWTSLGLALIEAMHLGLPVVAVGATEAFEAIPQDCGVVSTHLDRLVAGARDLVGDAERARVMGKHAREYALARYGLGRFLADWDRLLEEVTS